MSKAIPILSQFHNLSAGDLADEHGQLCAQIADLETRKRTIAGELIRRGVSEVEGALLRSLVVAETMVSTLDRQGIEKAMGEAWVARFPEILEALGLCQNDGPHRRRPDGSVGRAERWQRHANPKRKAKRHPVSARSRRPIFAGYEKAA